MPAADDVLDLIKARFTGRESLIERAYRHDLSFRSMCEDYHDCVDALERLRKEDSIGALKRREEYDELLEELGCEIRDWLGAHAAG